MHPQTNGMVERFNGRIADILKKTTFDSANDLKATLLRYELVYNEHLSQRSLNHVPPIEKLKEFYQKKPKLFWKRPVNRRGPDS